ncbi:MAG: succinylglutamate desuccinylase/aspartoacylase family protein [Nitrospira sp.]
MKKQFKVLVNVGTHGTERIGLKVLEKLKNLNPKSGKLETNIANPKALKKGVRFISHDLNRSFPGNKKGSYEQRLAHNLIPKLKSTNLVIDIHSTESDIREAMIVTRYTKKIKKLIKAVGPKYVLVMKISKSNALISHSKLGVAFEYGNDKSIKTLTGTVGGIKNILRSLGMIEGVCKPQHTKTKIYIIKNTFPRKSSDKLMPEIKNFTLVKKGQVVAKNRDKLIRSEKSFYPILFREPTYKDIFGFMGEYLGEI